MSYPEQTPETIKYLTNARSGYQVVKDLTSYPSFAGFPESLKSRLAIVLRFTPESVARFSSMAQRINSSAESSLAKLIMAGRDFPLHSIVLEIKTAGYLTPIQENDLRTQIETSEIISRLTGLRISYNYPFVDKGGNIIIAATEIPDPILKARATISNIGVTAGLAPLPLDNILHISTARPQISPPTEKNFDYYRLGGVRQDIRSGLLTMQVAGITIRNSYYFLTSPLVS